MSSCDCHENIEDEASITNVADTAEIEDYQLITIVAAVVLFTLRALRAEQHSALLASKLACSQNIILSDLMR